MNSLTFERIEGRSVRPDDLPRVAALLGHAHGAAWASDLPVRTSLETRAPLRDRTRFDELPRPPESRPAATPRTGLPAELRAALHAMFGLLENDGPRALRLLQGQRRNFIVTSRDIVAVDID
ncbi:hypothetical protein [Streptomyces sp. KL116D]|uniref:hypothetical protein n=1 Tax=Streptomyces sp. KL116D TaxID=3045152 RepID=UPI0035573927